MANQVLTIVFDDDTSISAIEDFVETVEKLIFDWQLVVQLKRSEEDFETGVIYAED